MYSEALSQMHLPHSHLPWLLQMPWEGRGNSRRPRAIVDMQQHWESARCQLPAALSLGLWGNLLQPCLVQLSLAQARQDLPLGCRCRCHCLWDIRSPDPPSRSRTRMHPWSSDHDLRRKRRHYPGTGTPLLPWPCSQAAPALPLSLGCKGAANRLHSVLPAHLQVQSPPQPITGHSTPCASATSPGTPCLCHRHGAGHSAPHNQGMLGVAGLLSPLQRKPEVRGHCRTSYWQNAPSKRCVRSSE